MTAEEPEQVEEPAADNAAGPAPEAEPEVPEVAEPVEAVPTLEELLAERTADLQRLQAEYINYKRRVDRDRVLIKAQGEASVLRSLLTVLDDMSRAAEHGELEGGFKAVADALQQAVKGHKLETFGVKGEPFDPRLHEALFHAGESADVNTTTVDSVIRTGYRVGEDVIRHAQVSVIDPPSAPVEPVDESPVEPVDESPVEPAETPTD